MEPVEMLVIDHVERVCPSVREARRRRATNGYPSSMRRVVLAMLAAAALRAQEVSPCNNTPAYSTCELVFEFKRGRRGQASGTL